MHATETIKISLLVAFFFLGSLIRLFIIGKLSVINEPQPFNFCHLQIVLVLF